MDVKTVLGALGRFMKGLKDYNIMELLKILFALFVIALIIAFIRKPEIFVDKVSYIFEMRENRKEQEHASGMYRRKVADQNIRGYLNQLRDLSGADRAWLLENMGRASEALPLWKRVLELHPDATDPAGRPVRDRIKK